MQLTNIQLPLGPTKCPHVGRSDNVPLVDQPVTLVLRTAHEALATRHPVVQRDPYRLRELVNGPHAATKAQHQMERRRSLHTVRGNDTVIL